jgi:hypothetical protein
VFLPGFESLLLCFLAHCLVKGCGRKHPWANYGAGKIPEFYCRVIVLAEFELRSVSANNSVTDVRLLW